VSRRPSASTWLGGARSLDDLVAAAVFHLRREGETMNAVSNAVIGLVAAFVAYGRFVLEPFT
jgi:hypothetical protein